jgi:hypothetical protein
MANRYLNLNKMTIMLPGDIFSNNPDSIHVLGQRWLSVSNIVGAMLANDVGPMKFCPSALGWPNKLGLRWPNDFYQQCLQFANKVPTNFGRKLWWANDGPSMTQ